ncbi:ATP-binding protein [Streptomyces phaeochromogenes]|uniref:ATP-binding protein n=1 Tax=Streptomyces phaeochromogenes TaxID=1923 RepID=UPI00367C8F5E
MTPTATIMRTAPRASFRLIPRLGVDVAFARSSGTVDGAIAAVDGVWPKRMRRIVRAGLSRWERPELIEDAELLVTELVTNALRHGRGDIGVRLHLSADRIRIEVRDGARETPVLRTATSSDEDGRGLYIVRSIADDWGTSPDGTTTWCTLTLREGTTT